MFLATRQSSPALRGFAWFVAFLYLGLTLAAVLHQHHAANTAAVAGSPHHAAIAAGPNAGATAHATAELCVADGCALCQIAAQTATPAAFALIPALRPVEHALAAPPLPSEPQLLPLAALSRYASRAPPVA